MNLAGLGYIAGGISQGLDAGTRRRLEDLQAQSMQQTQAGQGDAGRALMGMSGVASPQQQQGGLGGLGALLKGAMGGGQPQAQPGPPMQLAGGNPATAMPPQAAPQQAQPMQPQGGQAQQVPPQFQQAAQMLDFNTLTNTLAKTPGMTPERLMGALSALQPFMNTQAQMDHKKFMEQVALMNAGSTAKRADTYATTEPIKADASAKRAETGAKNEASLEASRAGRLEIDQAKLDQGAKHLQMLEKAAGARDKAGAERYFTQLNGVRANAMIAAHGDANDPTVKGIDEQIKVASARLQELQAAPSEHPAGWEGKDKGRAEPLVATPTPEKPKGKVSVDGGAPKAGDVMEGYKFKGGDPSKKENWEKV